MMSSGKQVGVFLTVVIVIVVFLTLIFRGGSSSKKNTTKAPPKAFSLVDYIDRNSEVTELTDGRINGDDVHRSVLITVNKDSRKVEVMQGYKGTVIKSQEYPNNTEAYDAFLHALARTGFGKTRKSTIISEDGVCATGRRYVFELTQDSKSVSRTWTANCLKGSATVDPDTVSNLFRRQITDYDKITNNVIY